MLILGIDPGSQQTGYALLRCVHDDEPQIKVIDVLKMDGKAPFDERIHSLFHHIKDLITKLGPDVIGIEEPFRGRLGGQVSVRCAQTAAAVMLGVVDHPKRINYAWISIGEAKRAACGNGSASKERVHLALSERFGDPLSNHGHDASDAAAVGLALLVRFKKK